jgi:dihydroorotate dehydrogenase
LRSFPGGAQEPFGDREGDREIPHAAYRFDRSHAWNYGHPPALPRIRRIPEGPGGRLLDYPLNSPIGIAAGILLNSKWVEGYARLGYDVLTYGTVRSVARPAHPLPNIRSVENREQTAVATKRPAAANGDVTVAVSTGMPSMEPDVWRRDVRRAKEKIGRGQVLIVNVMGTPEVGTDPDGLIADYALCAVWAAEAGADIIEVNLACPNPFGEPGQMVYESIAMSAQVLYRVRTSVKVPVVAKLGAFRTPRQLHETATKLAPWAHGFTLVHGIHRRVVDDDGTPAFDGPGREAYVVGADTFGACARQVEEMLAWRKAGAWDRAVLAVGGITTGERALHLLREGADCALVATAALFDPLFAARFRQLAVTAA